MKKYLILISILCLLATTSFAGDGIKAAICAKNRAVAGGSENIGQEADGADSGYPLPKHYIVCQKLAETPSHNGSVDSIIMNLYVDGAETDIKFAIYSHDAVNDLPDSAISNSDSGAIALTGASYTDRTFNYSTKPSLTSGTQYWLCYQHEESVGSLFTKKDDTVGNTKFKFQAYGSWASFGGSADETNAVRTGKFYLVNSW